MNLLHVTDWVTHWNIGIHNTDIHDVALMSWIHDVV